MQQEGQTVDTHQTGFKAKRLDSPRGYKRRSLKCMEADPQCKSVEACEAHVFPVSLVDEPVIFDDGPAGTTGGIFRNEGNIEWPSNYKELPQFQGLSRSAKVVLLDQDDISPGAPQ